jgi:hypothetical protein
MRPRHLSTHRILVPLLAVLVTLVPIGAVTASPAVAAVRVPRSAAADPFGPYVIMQNEATNRCLDDSFAFGLRAFPCNRLSYQRWDVAVAVSFTRGLSLTLRNQNTRRCLDDSSAFGLRTFPCNFSEYQHFYPLIISLDGGTELINGMTRRCVDDSFAFGLRSYPCNLLSFQTWRKI